MASNTRDNQPVGLPSPAVEEQQDRQVLKVNPAQQVRRAMPGRPVHKAMLAVPECKVIKVLKDRPER